MRKNRIYFDIIAIIVSVSLVAAGRVFLEWYYPSIEATSVVEPLSFLMNYSIFLYVIIGVICLLYGWKIRRWFIKTTKSSADKPLNYIFKIFIPLFSVLFIITLVVHLTSLRYIIFLFYSVNALIETIQIFVIFMSLGILFYSPIEKLIGPLLFNEILLDNPKKLGLALMEKQVISVTTKAWKYGLIMIAVFIAIANFMFFISYPLIPSINYDATLTIALPNFHFHFDPEANFRQEFFVLKELPRSILLDWKLVQSLMCIAFLAIMYLLIYLPREQEHSRENNDKQEIIAKPEGSVDNIAYNLLSPKVRRSVYTPLGQIDITKPRKGSKLFQKMKSSDLLPVMNLVLLNFSLSMIIILFIQLFGFSTMQAEIDFNPFYIQLSKNFWAGFNEELTFRWILFGLPLFLINGSLFVITKLVKKVNRNNDAGETKNLFLQIFFRDKVKNPLIYLIGRWKKLSIIDLLFLLFSSFTFGYVHYQFGWEAWKIFQAGVGGLIFGYAFCKYGFHVSIFLHVVNNFVIGLLATPNIGLMINGATIIMLIYTIGLLYLIFVATKLIAGALTYLNRALKRSPEIITVDDME